MVSLLEKTTIDKRDLKRIAPDLYRVDLFFLKRGDVLIVPIKQGFSLPWVVSDWSQSPDEKAQEYAKNEIGIRIDQFDYPLGFRSCKYNGGEITSYALVPAMWREFNIHPDAKWVSPLRLPTGTTTETKDIMNHYFRRLEEELIYGSFTE